MKSLSAFALCLAIAGCANGYAEFYQTLPSAAVAQPTPGIEPSVRASTGDATKDADSMYAEGYIAIGYSSFNGPAQGLRGALEQGKKVGATYVVVSAQYAYTVSGAMPITTPTAQTSYTTGTVNAYGSGGYASGNYSGTTTTYGSQTAYVPYSIPRYDQAAVYFAPLPRTGLGAWLRLPTDGEARALGTARARIVRSVRRGSPAYNADLLPGDVIRAVDGQPFDEATVRQEIQSGQALHLSIDREGKPVEIAVTVPPQW